MKISRNFIIIPICLFILVAILYFARKIYFPSSHKYILSNSSRSIVTKLDFKKAPTTYPHTIVLAIVVCLREFESDTRDEAIVLLKSIIISAKLNKIRSVEVYFFLENVTRERDIFLEKLREFGYPFKGLKLITHFKSAVEAIPQKYPAKLVLEQNSAKCKNLRIFLPSALPNVDSILYLDTDIIVHGNLADLWKMFELMDNQQLIGSSADYVVKVDNVVPYPPPHKINSGVLLMNLTRMRDYGFEDKMMRIWFDLDKMQPRFSLGDQDRLNILLYYNPYLLFRLPCQFNYISLFCNLNECKNVFTTGLQILHGANAQFMGPWVFRNVYLAYGNVDMIKFNFRSKAEFRNHVRLEFKRFQDKSLVKPSIQELVEQCKSTLEKIL